MILKYSEGSNSPFIQIDENNKLIFSTLTEDKRKGFRWFAFNGITRQKVKYGKTGRFTMVTNHESCMPTVLLEKLPKRVKAKDGPLSPIVLKKLKSIMRDLCVDGWFPRENLENLGRALSGDEQIFEAEDFVDDDPTATKSYDDIGNKAKSVTLNKGFKRGKALKRKPKCKITSKIRKV